MSPRAVRVLGLSGTALYACFIVWLYARQPATLAEVKGGLAAAAGVYEVDAAHFAEALRYFRAEQFPEARAAFERADPAHRDARSQFYVAYTYYRQGWGRLYHDDALYRRGLEALDRAVALSADGRIVVEDPDLGLRSADELRAEMVRGLTVEASDLDPRRLFRRRK